MESAGEVKEDILLRLGELTIHWRVPISQKGILSEAERLYNDFYARLQSSQSIKNDESFALTVLAFQLAVQYIELRDSKVDNVLAPTMEKVLGDVEEALDKLEDKH
ncbi:MAG: hypothetical protein ACI35Q_09660 [Marinilabiliaceae bacterium]